MDDQDALGAKLDVLIKLTAASLVRDMSKREAIELLGRAGLERNRIAEVCQSSPHAVSVVLSEARKRSKNFKGPQASVESGADLGVAVK